MTAAPKPCLAGLYVLLDPHAVGGRDLVDCLTLAADAGVRLFQYRDKQSSGRDLYRRAERLRDAASRMEARLMINDRCDLVLAVDADGVHLGQDDLPVPHARALLGSSKIIGLSTHTPEQVEEGTRMPVDYLAFGPIFKTTTKTDHEPVVGVEGLARVRRMTMRPLFAIGGIDLARAQAVVETGVDGVAVISAVWASARPAVAIRAFIDTLSTRSRPKPE